MKMGRHLVIIPAAGSGARFRELGKQYPKCLLPYRGRTILGHLLDRVRQDISEGEVVIVVRPEDRDNELWPVEVRRVVVDFRRAQGPATSILTGLEALEAGAGDCVTVILSDMVLNDAFPLKQPRTDEDRLHLYSRVVDPGRWCLYVGGCQFLDKPNTPPPTGALAVLGVYHLKDARAFRSALEWQVGQGATVAASETQISTALSQYLRTTGGGGFERTVVPPELVEDLGTIEEYLARRPGIAPRRFNTVEYAERTVTKSSREYREKIRLEGLWLREPPAPYRECVPRVLEIHTEVDVCSYVMERIYGHNLRELALYYDRSTALWNRIFGELALTIRACWGEGSLATGGNHWPSVLRRIGERCPTLDAAFLSELTDALRPFRGESPYHGDLHLANVLWTGHGLRVLDPRGEHYGHWLYDVAKLTHSVLGRYDHIDEGLYAIRADGAVTYYDRGYDAVEERFATIVLACYSPEERRAIRLLTAGLFASLGPLHDSEEKRRLYWSEFEVFTKRKAPAVGRGLLRTELLEY